MNKRKNYLVLVAFSIFMLGCSTEAADNKSEASASSNKLPVDVTVVSYKLHNQEESVAGSILANREVDIASEISKKVNTVHFSDGSTVSKGQLLYKLDDGEIRARLKQTQAELALVKLTETRMSQLLRNESIRQEEYDVAKTKLESLEAVKELLDIELAKTSIHAPFSGLVGISKVQSGSLVSRGSPLVTIQEQGTVKIQFTVSEKYMEYLKYGKTIYFTVANNAEKIPAKISATEAFLDMESRTITVHAVTPNRTGKLRPGMSAKVFFSTVAEDSKALALPTEALMPSAGGYSVFVVKNGIAKMTSVSIGNRSESEALITSGLTDGDTVMISNILRTGEGTPVQIVSAKQ